MAGEVFIQSAVQQFKGYKALGDKTFEQLADEDFYYQPNEASNSIAIIIAHLHGNMLSRWTNFLIEDGEKEWRKRDNEFDNPSLSKIDLIEQWNNGWAVLFNALQNLDAADLEKTVYIRTKPLSVVDAIHRQLTHYASHVGQIIYLAKIIKGNDWETLSIPKGKSGEFNKTMMQ